MGNFALLNFGRNNITSHTESDDPHPTSSITIDAMCCENQTENIRVEICAVGNSQDTLLQIWNGSNVPTINDDFLTGNLQYYFTANTNTTIFVGLEQDLVAIVKEFDFNGNEIPHQNEQLDSAISGFCS